MTTTIQKWGNSQGIRISKFLLDSLKWSEDEQVTISTDENRIIIEKANHRKNIIELFDGFEGSYSPGEIDWGESAGEEIW